MACLTRGMRKTRGFLMRKMCDGNVDYFNTLLISGSIRSGNRASRESGSRALQGRCRGHAGGLHHGYPGPDSGADDPGLLQRGQHLLSMPLYAVPRFSRTCHPVAGG